MKKAVAYYRVSTDRQGESGLGLEAQEESVHVYTKARKIKLIKEYTEIESGKKNNRPILQEALHYCIKNKTLLIIAKLDRLGRNVAFISALMETNVEFVAVDNPEAIPLILHILAAFAQHERIQVSLRTKSALQAAKRRGVELGKYGKTLASKNKKDSIAFANKMRPTINKIKKAGFKTVREITGELNRRKVPTFRNQGNRWHVSTVYNLLNKLYSR